MNPAAFEEMAETEGTHWWFVGRRAIIASVIERLGLPRGAQILEIGCGTGGNLELLSRFGELSAMEADPHARSVADRKAGGRCVVEAGSCPNDMAFEGQQFDLICMFDVLEHIDADVATLVSVRRLLGARGQLLITVPAYQWLWSGHDDFLHHKRRYTATSLIEKGRKAGLRTIKWSYFNTALFPVAAAMRLKDRFSRRESTLGGAMPPSAINAVLARVLSAERFGVSRFSLPFGVSLLCILTRDDLGR